MVVSKAYETTILYLISFSTLILLLHHSSVMAEESSPSKVTQAGEGRADAVPELDCSVRPPDTSDREATELQPWPLQRAPTRPQANAGYYAHFRHWIHGFSMNARVPPEASRDHLANERTFLGWVRTSISLAIIGTVIAQLFRLQHSPVPQPFGFYRLGVPLASICHGAALLMVLVGAQRFRSQQNAMIDGRTRAGGWEPLFVGVMVMTVSTALRKWCKGSRLTSFADTSGSIRITCCCGCRQGVGLRADPL
jgi:uncharacterized membrane protein YidH (DUF202 family)